MSNFGARSAQDGRTYLPWAKGIGTEVRASRSHANVDPLGPKPWLINYEVMTFAMIAGVLVIVAGFLLVTYTPCSTFYRAGCPRPFEGAGFPAILAGVVILVVSFAVRFVRSSDY